MKIRVIINIVSAIVAITGVFMSSCIYLAWHLGEGSYIIQHFSMLSISTTVSGSFIFYKTRGKTMVHFREGFAIVTFGWIAVSVIGALPYIGLCNMSFTDAVFETMSGITTTGFSVIDDVTQIPKTVLFWRAVTNWFGGMGIVIFTMAILPILGVGGMQLYKAESAGPTNEQITSRIATTAKILWLIYIGLTIILFFILKALGMPWFDSLCHSFSTMATGGFSTQGDSMTSYSNTIKIVITIFMFPYKFWFS